MILLAVMVSIVWAAGLLLVAGRAVYGYCTLWSLGRYGSVPLTRDDVDFDQLARRMGVEGLWQLRQCATRELAVPMTWGFRRPIVMLPSDADRWSQNRLEAVVLHELSHIQRRDFLVQASMELACAVFWFIPPMWSTAEDHRSRVEHEADQDVLRSGMRASDYAAELLAIAAEIRDRRLPAIYGATPAMKNSKIEARLHAILRSDTPRRPDINS